MLRLLPSHAPLIPPLLPHYLAQCTFCLSFALAGPPVAALPFFNRLQTLRLRWSVSLGPVCGPDEGTHLFLRPSIAPRFPVVGPLSSPPHLSAHVHSLRLSFVHSIHRNLQYPLNLSEIRGCVYPAFILHRWKVSAGVIS